MSLSNEGHNSNKCHEIAYIWQKDKERRTWYLHCLVDDSGFLQQVLRYLRSDHRSSAGELHLQVLAKAAGVVIDDGAGVPKSLHQAVDQQDLLLERPIVGLNKASFQVSDWESNIVEVIILLSRNDAWIPVMCLSIPVFPIKSDTAFFYIKEWNKKCQTWIEFSIKLQMMTGISCSVTQTDYRMFILDTELAGGAGQDTQLLHNSKL